MDKYISSVLRDIEIPGTEDFCVGKIRLLCKKTDNVTIYDHN